MKSLNLYDKKGKKTNKKVKLDDSIFGSDVNQNLVSQAVYIYLQNQRQTNAHTKDRSEVRGGGKKPWRQKGTGRARHGSIRSPIWKGGGVTFGPRNIRNYTKKMNKSAKKKAMKDAFTMKTEAKEVIVIENFDTKKTKEVQGVLKNLGVEGRVTFVQVDEKGLNKATKNIENVETVRTGELNVYEILNNKCLVIMEDALKDISDKWGKKK
ncbi:50S ribosomal protein L4 [Candidatus Dojkabacteria bacterium]|nr:50S ribosomal protein L4 [Candidatus Dojkabacteria bacterium]